MSKEIIKILAKSQDRYELCINIINENAFKKIAEVGVYKGDFAEKLLTNCPLIEKYAMIDPWRNLSDWNKPANKNDITFEKYYAETMSKTHFAKNKRVVFRGKTTEVIDQIPANEFDFIYIDGDHTLKGITIDLISFWSKLKDGGIIMGDDFFPSIWEHSKKYEPTLVFPYAVFFAEGVNAKIFALPFGQFLIEKQNNSVFEFIDLTGGQYSNLQLKSQLSSRVIEAKRILKKVSRKSKDLAKRLKG